MIIMYIYTLFGSNHEVSMLLLVTLPLFLYIDIYIQLTTIAL